MKLKRLPRYDWEEVNTFLLIDRLALVEKELATVKQDVSHFILAVQQTTQQQRKSYTDVSRASAASVVNFDSYVSAAVNQNLTTGLNNG